LDLVLDLDLDFFYGFFFFLIFFLLEELGNKWCYSEQVTWFGISWSNTNERLISKQVIYSEHASNSRIQLFTKQLQN
jgi:hypothetical protein